MAQNQDRRIILYPSYLDSSQTVAEGRVLAKEQAVNLPDVMEMHEACKQLGLQSDIEDKQYPRAWWIRGRLRVTLKNQDGTPVNPEIPSKRVLMIKIAELIKKIPNRPKRLNPMQAAAQQAVMMAGGNAAAVAASAGSSGAGSSSSKSGSTSNKKKKGKK